MDVLVAENILRKIGTLISTQKFLNKNGYDFQCSRFSQAAQIFADMDYGAEILYCLFINKLPDPPKELLNQVFNGDGRSKAQKDLKQYQEKRKFFSKTLEKLSLDELRNLLKNLNIKIDKRHRENTLIQIILLNCIGIEEDYFKKLVENPNQLESFVVVKPKTLEIKDGDTVAATISDLGVISVRLIGIDAPEATPNKKIIKDFRRIGYSWSEEDCQTLLEIGLESTEYLIHLIDIESVRLQMKTYNGEYSKDKYGRYLAYLLLGNEDLCYKMLESGFATVWPRRIKYHAFSHPKIEQYISACNKAANSKKALWKKGMNMMCPQFDKKQRTLSSCMSCCHVVIQDEE